MIPWFIVNTVFVVIDPVVILVLVIDPVVIVVVVINPVVIVKSGNTLVASGVHGGTPTREITPKGVNTN